MSLNEKSERDRLVELETKFVVMIDNFTKAIEKLERKLDHREENYVTKEILEIRLKQQESRIQQLEDSKKENRNLIPTWTTVVVSVAAVGVAVIALFVN